MTGKCYAHHLTLRTYSFQSFSIEYVPTLVQAFKNNLGNQKTDFCCNFVCICNEIQPLEIFTKPETQFLLENFISFKSFSSEIFSYLVFKTIIKWQFNSILHWGNICFSASQTRIELIETFKVLRSSIHMAYQCRVTK